MPGPPKNWTQGDFANHGDWDLTLGSVFGFRQWRLIPYLTSGLLMGANGYLWKGADPGPAACRYGRGVRCYDHVPPQLHCCGYYAFWDIDSTPAIRCTTAGPVIVGVIEGTGPTIVGTRGFQSHNARILALHFPTLFKVGSVSETLQILERERTRQTAEECLRSVYKVPVYASMELMLYNHPLTEFYKRKEQSHDIPEIPGINQP